ncbi:hypothetical protein CPB84DRAFT_705480 [Gymnopilus junonius]|uniref:Uncharacterized protein n=1 Tax=Gymnopilus junonius TaxID=109634 RepID=A0A9P5TFS6_GYMJU|nr:hypothetical protein CPB84DRAFT_705480 [Gymnopilus junonius]
MRTGVETNLTMNLGSELADIDGIGWDNGVADISAIGQGEERGCWTPQEVGISHCELVLLVTWQRSEGLSRALGAIRPLEMERLVGMHLRRPQRCRSLDVQMHRRKEGKNTASGTSSIWALYATRSIPVFSQPLNSTFVKSSFTGIPTSSSTTTSPPKVTSAEGSKAASSSISSMNSLTQAQFWF